MSVRMMTHPKMMYGRHVTMSNSLFYMDGSEYSSIAP